MSGSLKEAVALVRREHPDLLFLDVQMSEGDGFDVLEAIGGEHLPEVIFVTAHEQHALRAFDVAAVDFLLKPGRAGARPDGTCVIERFAVRTRDRFILVPALEVEWIQAAANYAELHVASATHLVRATLADLEAGLDPARFARIHRGTLVRIDCVREVIPAAHGDYEVVLHGGAALKLSRRFRARLLP